MAPKSKFVAVLILILLPSYLTHLSGPVGLGPIYTVKST